MYNQELLKQAIEKAQDDFVVGVATQQEHEQNFAEKFYAFDSDNQALYFAAGIEYAKLENEANAAPAEPEEE